MKRVFKKEIKTFFSGFNCSPLDLKNKILKINTNIGRNLWEEELKLAKVSSKSRQLMQMLEKVNEVNVIIRLNSEIPVNRAAIKGLSKVNYRQSLAFDRPNLSSNGHCDRWLFQEVFIIIIIIIIIIILLFHRNSFKQSWSCFLGS